MPASGTQPRTISCSASLPRQSLGCAHSLCAAQGASGAMPPGVQTRVAHGQLLPITHSVASGSHGSPSCFAVEGEVGTQIA